MKWNDDKSLFLTRIFVWLSAAALAALCVSAPWIFSWFIRERMILSADSRIYFLATTYTTAIPAAAALYMMNRLLANIKREDGIDLPGQQFLLSGILCPLCRCSVYGPDPPGDQKCICPGGGDQEGK